MTASRARGRTPDAWLQRLACERPTCIAFFQGFPLTGSGQVQTFRPPKLVG